MFDFIMIDKTTRKKCQLKDHAFASGGILWKVVD